MFPRPKQSIGSLLLFIRHAAVERLVGRDEPLELVQAGFGNLTLEFHLLDTVHGLHGISAVLGKCVHVFRIIAHHQGKVAPQWFLLRGDLQRDLEFRDAGLGMFDRRGSGNCRRFLFG